MFVWKASIWVRGPCRSSTWEVKTVLNKFSFVTPLFFFLKTELLSWCELHSFFHSPVFFMIIFIVLHLEKRVIFFSKYSHCFSRIILLVKHKQLMCSCIKKRRKEKGRQPAPKNWHLVSENWRKKNMSVLPHFFCRGYLQCKKKILVYISFMIHSLHVFEEFGIFKGIYILSLLV